MYALFTGHAQPQAATAPHPVTVLLQAAQNAARVDLARQRANDPQAAKPCQIQEEEDLSPAAVQRKSQMSALYQPLPPGLPSWETLAHLDPGVCIQYIENRRADTRDQKNEISSLSAATSEMLYPETIDDCLQQLHPARFLRASLAHHSLYWDQVPVKLENVVVSMPLAHLGIDNCFAPITIKRLHDRSHVITLNHLLKSNWAVETAAPILKRQKVVGTAGGDVGVDLVPQLNFKEPDNVRQVQEAIHSYVILMHRLHPADWGPLALSSTLTKWQYFFSNHISKAEQLLTLKLFVDKVLMTNASKAENKTPPLDVRELHDIAKDTLRDRGRPQVLPDLADQFGVPQPVLTRQDQFSHPPPLHPIMRGAGRGIPVGRGKQPNILSSPPGKIWAKRWGNLDICVLWNKQGSCKRSSGSSCTTAGNVTLHHRCGTCGSNNHGQRDHR